MTTPSIATDPVRLWADACRTMIARCQAAVPTLQDAIDDPTPENVDKASVVFTDLWECARSGDKAIVMMHKQETMQRE